MNSERLFLASDYDCTLYSHKTIRIEEFDREAVKRFRKAGNLFAIVTGRSVTNITNALEEAEFYDYDVIISMNGTAARLPDGSFLFESKGDVSVLPELFGIIEKTGGTMPAVVSRFDEYYVGSGTEWYGEHPFLTPEECLSLDFFSCIFSTYPDIESAKIAVNEIKDKLGSFVNPQRNGVHVDIPPVGTDKGSSVMKAALLLGADKENIYAVGDNMNDASMITRFKGYAMESGSPELQSLAAGTTKSVSELIHLIMKD